MIRSSVGLSLAVMVGTSCATVTASVDFDPRADFTRYRTYTWGPPDSLSVGDPRLDANPVFDQRVPSAVERELAERGFTRRTETPAGLEVRCHTSVAERMDVYAQDAAYGYQPDPWSGTNVRVFEQGTLVADISERIHRWAVRGWEETELGDMFDELDELERRINEGCRRCSIVAAEEWPAGRSVTTGLAG